MNLITSFIKGIREDGNFYVIVPDENNKFLSRCIGITVNKDGDCSYCSYYVEERKHSIKYIDDDIYLCENEDSIYNRKKTLVIDDLTEEQLKTIVANFIYYSIECNNYYFSLSSTEKGNDILADKIFRYATQMLSLNKEKLKLWNKENIHYVINEVLIKNCYDKTRYNYSHDFMYKIIDTKVEAVNSIINKSYQKTTK